MNDGLLALKRLKGEGRGNGIYDEIDVDQDFDRAEYYLEVIDIVKEKRVDVALLILCESEEEYNFQISLIDEDNENYKELTKLDFSHLKEVFDND